MSMHYGKNTFEEYITISDYVFWRIKSKSVNHLKDQFHIEFLLIQSKINSILFSRRNKVQKQPT